MINNNHRFTFSIDSKKRPFGFTVVELLIVIVVIGIIATITVISYSGIQEKSIRNTVEADLRSASSALETAKSKSGGYPTTKPADLPKSNGTEYTYVYYGTSKSFCLAATTTEGDIPSIYLTSDNSTIKEGTCSAPTGGTVPAITTASLPAVNRNTAYNATIAASGTPAPTFSIGSGALPTGLTLNSTTGKITGTPTVSGTFEIGVKAQNTNGSVTRVFTITVNKITTELLVNGGFESGTTGWQGPITSLSTGGAKVGTYYGKVDNDTVRQYLPVTAGDALTVTGWVQHDGNGIRDVYVQAIYYNASGGTISSALIYDGYPASTSWVSFSKSLTVPSGAVSMEFYFWPGLGGTCKIDDVSITVLK